MAGSHKTKVNVPFFVPSLDTSSSLNDYTNVSESLGSQVSTSMSLRPCYDRAFGLGKGCPGAQRMRVFWCVP
jgi:hypothetical protein